MLTTTCITQEIFEAFLKCPRKSHLVSGGTIDAQSEFAEWQARLAENYKETASARLRSTLRPNEWYVGTHTAERLHERSYCLVFDYAVAEPEARARLHALEINCSRGRTRHHSYTPIRFVPKEKVTVSDKQMLGFDAFAFSRATGEIPAVGKIIHGRRYSVVRFQLPKLLRGVQSIVEKIVGQRAEPSTPPVVLNNHCTECQFQSSCREIAHEKDDLSLLPTISDKERRKYREKGIFTVTQLSYAFRPRRRSTPGVTKHLPALKALAIRQGKIHILGTPTLNRCGTPVYFDVEGDADGDFYYLIGVRTGNEAASTQHYFWADDPGAEEKIWAEFLGKLTQIEKTPDSPTTPNSPWDRSLCRNDY